MEDKKIKEKLNKELEIYKKIYDLKTVTQTSEVKKEFFEYCRNTNHFVLLVLYDNEGRIYLEENGIDEFCLPGGKIKEKEINLRDTVKRIVNNIDDDIKIRELEPIALIENKFKNEGLEIIHNGIAMIARVENKTNFLKQNFYEITENLYAIIKAFSNIEIVKLFKERYKNIVQDNNSNFQDEEINVNAKYQKRYKFHNKIVKKYFLTSKLKKTDKLIKIMTEKSQNAKNMIDISCGDNSLLFKLIKNDQIEYLMANDICWSQIELIESRDKVLFSNHNALTFPFKSDSFDFVYCSNTLHHMPSTESLNKLLESLLRIGKKVVIYEIENPAVTKGFPYFLNKYYYRGFLNDVGEEYLSFDDFKKHINETYREKAHIEFSNFKNIQGNYMIAEITKVK